MASSPTCSSSSVPETVFEGLEFSEANNILLMALMEETEEDDQDHNLYYVDDERLMSMIQSLEAEISSSSSSHQRYDDDDVDHPVGQADGQDCSTSSVCTTDHDDWMDIEVASAATSSSSSAPPFDEQMLMSAWSPCAAGGDYSSDYSEFSYGILLDNYSYLPQEACDHVVF